MESVPTPVPSGCSSVPGVRRRLLSAETRLASRVRNGNSSRKPGKLLTCLRRARPSGAAGRLLDCVTQEHNYQAVKRVQWAGATVWHFSRQQHSSSVPSDGEVSLGMESVHWQKEEVALPDPAPLLLDMELGLGVPVGLDQGGGKRLSPLPVPARVSLLRAAGVTQLDRAECTAIARLQRGRADCGCACVGTCLPEQCLCATNGIECEVDTEGFPCRCSESGCGNPEGRRVFSRQEVDSHYSTAWTLWPQQSKLQTPQRNNNTDDQ